MDRTTISFEAAGRKYTYGGYLGAADALLVKKHAGMSALEMFSGIFTGDPGSLVALVFLAKRQAGERITWDETVALLDGEDDLMALVASMSSPEDEAPAEEEKAPKASPPAKPRAARTAA
jgi:hypothetical protein